MVSHSENAKKRGRVPKADRRAVLQEMRSQRVGRLGCTVFMQKREFVHRKRIGGGYVLQKKIIAPILCVIDVTVSVVVKRAETSADAQKRRKGVKAKRTLGFSVQRVSGMLCKVHVIVLPVIVKIAMMAKNAEPCDKKLATALARGIELNKDAMPVGIEACRELCAAQKLPKHSFGFGVGIIELALVDFKFHQILV